VSTGQTGNLIKNDKLQFSKGCLSEFGDLACGQIPESLKFEREGEFSSLSNGVRVLSEGSAGGLTAISVAIKAGTRQETLETSGASQYIKKLITRGTNNMTREQVE
jgi:processing peptidase subunit beta